MARHRVKPCDTYPVGTLVNHEPHPTEPNMLRVYIETKHRHVIPVDVPTKLITYAQTHHRKLGWCTQQQQTELHAYIRKETQ